MPMEKKVVMGAMIISAGIVVLKVPSNCYPFINMEWLFVYDYKKIESSTYNVPLFSPENWQTSLCSSKC